MTMLPAIDTVWHEAPWCVIDLETDGPDPAAAVPCEIAVARFEGGEVVGSWSMLLNPGRELSAEVIGVHGITNEMVSSEPPAVVAVARMMMCGLLNGAWPVGYNGQGYDRAVLRRLAGSSANECAWLHARWLDPLIYIRDIGKYDPGSGRHKLSAVCERRGIPHEGKHRALGDATAAGKLLWSMRQRLGDFTIAELLHKQTGRAVAQQVDYEQWKERVKKAESAKQRAAEEDAAKASAAALDTPPTTVPADTIPY